MPRLYPGRYAAQIEGDFIVFLIGLRLNRLVAPHKWLPVLMAMPPMLAELFKDPGLGLLHAETLVGWRTATVIQYWRSFEQLHAYAHDRNARHLPAWAAFNRSIGDDGTVGIFHETYLVPAGGYESIYANMPRIGLARAGSHLPASERFHTALARIAANRSDTDREI